MITLNELLNPPEPRDAYRAERLAERAAAAQVQLDRNIAAELERNRIEQRSTWEKIDDLSIDYDLKEILWSITAKLEL